jgi:3-methylfumaryl-CoA hydratase
VSVALRSEDLHVGDELPSRAHTPTNVSLFAYNAAVWNAHRIHYDAAYTTQVEKHPGIVIDGPLQGDWLAQSVTNWLCEDGVLERFAYSNRRAAYLGETLTSGGRVVAVDPSTRVITLELWVKNERGEITSPGSATVRLRA